MSVQVENLSKKFGEQRAVDAVSFKARKGEVLGFLGPNGAGKSTTMKIITCFLPQTEGKVSVCGYDTGDDPMAVRRRIGYLPENNPLYEDMYVREYLEFVARLHHFKAKKQRVAEMIELTGLQLEQHKLIGALSKGYRQRVGLAQAMLHDPEVLILDEPTSGLDPNQLVDIRHLIKRLGKEKTVIFSTHIMQEVQALCDRVLIINRGKIVADDPIDQLERRISGERMLSVLFKEKPDTGKLGKVKGVLRVGQAEDGRWLLASSYEEDIRERVFRFAVNEGLTILEMNQRTFSVEDIFQQLTKNPN